MRPREINLDAPFQTPRNAAFITGLSLWYIREGCKAGTIPHIRVGRDYRVDMPQLLEQLNRESRKTALRSGTPGGGKTETSLCSMVSDQHYNTSCDPGQAEA